MIRMKCFVLDNVCFVSATNALLTSSSRPAGCRRAGQAQAGTKQLHIVCAQTYEYAQVFALSIRTKNPSQL